MGERAEGFRSWGVVEVMGHQTIAGLISEQVIAGTAFVRVDVPANEDGEAFTKLLGAGSIYSISPTSEEFARAAARRLKHSPVNIYVPELHRPQEPRALPAGGFEPDYDDEFSEE